MDMWDINGNYKTSILKGKKRRIPTKISLIGYFSRQLSRGKINPAAPAVLQDGEVKLTFEKLDEESSKLAEAIRKQIGESGPNSVNNDIIIGFCLLPTERVIIIIFAILKLGAVCLPLDTTYSEEKMEKIVSTARPSLIIADSSNPVLVNLSCVAHLTDIITSDLLFSMASTIKADKNVIPLFSNLKPHERPSHIIFTSGSIGRARGVKIEQKSIFNRICWEWLKYPFKAGECFCCSSPVISVDSLGEYFGPLLAGYPLALLHSNLTTRPEIVCDTIQSHRLTRFHLTPDSLNILLKYIEDSDNPDQITEALSTLRYVYCSSKTLQIELGERFFTILKGISLINGYVTTESLLCTAQTFRSAEDFISKTESFHVPIGKPIINTRVYIIDEDQKINRIEKSGEICISGLGISTLGYVGGVKSAKFVANQFSKSGANKLLFRTGDYGRIIKDHKGKKRLYFEGRIDTQVKVHGKKVDLNTILSVIRATERIEDVAMACQHPAKENQIIIAAVVLKEGETEEGLKERLMDMIPMYMIPEIFAIPEIPKFSNGKLDKLELFKQFNKERHEATDADWAAAQIQENELEGAKILCKIIAETIGVSLKYIIRNFQSSFWELGGNSLNTVRAVLKIQEHNYPISLDDFILAKNIPEILFSMIYNRENSKMDYMTVMCFSARANYLIEDMTEDHKLAVFQLLAKCYVEKDELNIYTRATMNEYKTYLESIWSFLVDQKLSLIARKKTTLHIVGVMINFDGFNKVLTGARATPRSINTILQLNKSCAVNAKMKVPSGKTGKIVETHMMGTCEELSPGENVLLIQLFLKEICFRSEQRGFGIFLITTTNQLIRQLCDSLIKCDKVLEYPVNQFTTQEKTTPFRMAGDYINAHVYLKKLS